jgi:hypothetical protein
MQDEDFPLDSFYELRNDLNLRKSNFNNFISYYLDLKNVFNIIKLSLLRLNDHIDKFNDYNKLFLLYKDGKTSPNDEKEMLKLEIHFVYFKLDCKTLFIQSSIFMDKIGKFLSVLFQDRGPESKNYFHFVNSINKYKNKGIDELIRLINAYPVMYDELKNIRDNYIIHQSKETLGSVIGPDYFSISLGTRKGGMPKFVSISNEYIDVFTSQLKSYLKNLNKYLCNNVEKIPFRISR